MKAILLSAGQGSRLLPLTSETPKCLLPVGDCTVLQWQIECLDPIDEIDEIIVVTGFMSHKVEAALDAIEVATPLTTVFNPFYNISDNLATCWLARDYMVEDFMIVNGDSLVERAVTPVIMKNANAPINLTTNVKSSFDSDDMKVTLEGDLVRAVGKNLLSEETHAESIGMVVFKGEGRDIFRAELESGMRSGSGLNAWYLQAIDHLAKRGCVGAIDIGEMEWCEIDFPSDLEAAQKLVANWKRLRLVA